MVVLDKVLDQFARVSALWDPTRLHAWAEPYRRRAGMRAFAVRQLEIFVFTARSLRGGEVTQRAAGLTYHTLLAIVPLLAVLFAVFKAFGGLRQLEAPLRAWIVDNLAAGRAHEVGQRIEHFVDNISSGAIAGVGVVILFYSAVALLTNSENAFNRIWGVERNRPFLMRFAVYWCLMTVGPTLIGLSMSASAQLLSSTFASAVLDWLPWGLGSVLLSLGSVLAVCVMFVLAYMIVPNTKVRLGPALLGGTVAGLLWSAGKTLFIWATAGSVKYSAVYGALGALPLLMVWLYLSWIIVLFGVTFTYANQAIATGKLQEAVTTTSQRYREQLAAWLMVTITEAFRSGQPAPTAPTLADQSDASIGTVRHLLAILHRNQLVAETANEGDEGYLPRQDSDSLTLHRVVETLRTKEGASPALPDGAAQRRVREVMDQAGQASQAVLERANLRSLLGSPSSPDPEAR